MMEVQCLVSNIAGPYDTGIKIIPRRTADGFSLQRLFLLCAVIEKRLHLPLSRADIFLNVVGGLKLTEPTSDLAVAMTIVSSLSGIAVKRGVAFIGEIGLRGELRDGCKYCDRRIIEAEKIGFTTIIIPKVLVDPIKTQPIPRNSNDVKVNNANVNSMTRPDKELISLRTMGTGLSSSISKANMDVSVVPCSSLFEAVDAGLVGGMHAVRCALASKKEKNTKTRMHDERMHHKKDVDDDEGSVSMFASNYDAYE